MGAGGTPDCAVVHCVYNVVVLKGSGLEFIQFIFGRENSMELIIVNK